LIPFSPEDPFPLLPEGKYSYQEQQEHSAKVDMWLELKTEETEAKLKKSPTQQLWVDLPVQAMLTPYTEIREILEKFDSEKPIKLIDLGSGYGRIGFVIARHFPNWKFIGYELVEERVIRAREALAKNPCARISFEVTDLTKSRPEVGDVFFIYDYGTRRAIEKTLQDLKDIAQAKKIIVIGRGRASRDAIERQHPWLSQVVEPTHFSHYSIYRSA
jgi:hypothetical protein